MKKSARKKIEENTNAEINIRITFKTGEAFSTSVGEKTKVTPIIVRELGFFVLILEFWNLSLYRNIETSFKREGINMQHYSKIFKRQLANFLGGSQYLY